MSQPQQIYLDLPPIHPAQINSSDDLRYTFTDTFNNLLQQTNHSLTSAQKITPNSEPFLNTLKTHPKIYHACMIRQFASELSPNIEQTALKDEPKDWFIKTADFGDEYDRVLQHRDGKYTQLLEDLEQYHQILQQNCDRIIILRPSNFGAYDIQINAAMQCLGYTKDKFQFIIVQPLKLYAFHTPSQKITPIPDLSIEELLKTVEMDDLRWHSLRVPLDRIAPINISSVGTPTDSLYRVRATYHHCCELLDRANREGTIQLDTSNPQKWEIANTTQSLSDITWQDPNSEKLTQLVQTVPNIIEQSAKGIDPHLITQHLENISNVCYAWFTTLAPTLETYILLVNLRNTFYELMIEILGISLPR
ncbi:MULTISPECIES: hypothetical protein [Pseudanabaena]|uniref:Uncharacterized protein n=2 Tax=Pseudanabaena TaxID=1152 RepID=L8MZ63_9CYAN|nr:MULTISPECIES: hypothetical protein [Pseudanabaena]ELS32776.1 hypothetical protein Pse7429DRAFT_2145 [Pseudanabaena biceps PCC 7429]MDG3495003.1 hypothetical protein [Pseudanabaena catenata USMAC16]